MAPEEIRAALESIGAERVHCPDYKPRGVHVEALVAPDRVRKGVELLRTREFLIDHVTAVDAAPRLMVVYHFSHVGGGCRVAFKTLTDRETPSVPSIQDLYPGASWHERETHEFYGVAFEGHPDLSPLILPEDAGDLRPLRKDEQGLKTLGEILPEFAPPGGEGDKPRKPRPKEEKAPKGEGEE
jgi:NADH-quinone oxidoreductase subunit C